MRPRLSLAFLIALTAASAARAQGNVPGTWSTDPQCSAQALRVTFGRDTLTMERNGHLIYRGRAQVAVSEEAIAVRLAPGPGDAERPGLERPGPERNVIRFSRGSGAIRMIAATRDGATQHPRVPPLYPCRPAGAHADTALLPPAAVLPASGLASGR